MTRKPWEPGTYRQRTIQSLATHLRALLKIDGRAAYQLAVKLWKRGVVQA